MDWWIWDDWIARLDDEHCAFAVFGLKDLIDCAQLVLRRPDDVQQAIHLANQLLVHFTPILLENNRGCAKGLCVNHIRRTYDVLVTHPELPRCAVGAEPPHFTHDELVRYLSRVISTNPAVQEVSGRRLTF